MDDEEYQHLGQLRKSLRRRLRVLEEQKARFGFYVPHHIQTEIDETQEQLAEIDGQIASVGRLDVIIYTAASNVYAPDRLIGRADLLVSVHTLLDDCKHVLLCGLGGAGKTALAATIANQRISAAKGPVVWLQPGDAEAETVLDTMAKRFATRKRFLTQEEKREIASMQSIHARIVAVRDLLAEAEIGLLVLDDVWSASTLEDVLKAIPDGVPVLVTAREKFPHLELVEVSDLERRAALRLLGYHAGERDYSSDPEADMLCQELGDHAYALEIAGTTIVLDGYTPRTLRRQIAEAPDELLSLPGRRGRESVRKLLEISFSALSPEEQAVFQSFGALFAPGVTAALLATYRRSDVPPVEQALKTLVRRSLAKQKPVADYFYYSLHALTFSFARAKFRATGQDGGMTVAAIQRYVVDYAHDYSRLTSDQVNIIEAAKVAQHENGGALIKIMTALALEGYFDERGCNQEFLRLLEHTIEAVRQKGDGQDDTLHYLLGKCGNAHFNRGDLARAFECYRAALNLAPNNDRRVRLLGVLGKVCSAQGQYTEAETNFTQGYELAKTNNEELALGFVLEQWSDAAGRRRDFESARQFAAEAIEVTSRRKEQDPIRLSYLWLDLGTAEMDIGIRKALTAHQKAYELAKAIHNLPLMAHIHYALAYDYQALDQFDEAQEHFDAARKLWDDLEYTAEAAQITALMKRFGYLKTE